MKKITLLFAFASSLTPAFINAQCGPLITCPANISIPATSGQCGAIATYTATSIDQCPSGSATVFSEDFQSGGTGWTLNVNTGSNAATPNSWEVNATEGGVAPPGCGVANNGDLTLHITCTSAFCGSLITGAVYNANKVSNKRAESPSFSTATYSNLTLNFNFISNGSGLLDNASVLYNDGSGWQTLTASIKSPVCGGGQGQWTAYTATLPASCNNNPNVKIGFNWTNNADNVGTDPSVAINNITVTAPGSAASTIAYSPASGSFFPIGTTTVTAIATDAALLDDTCTFTVTVTDNQLPVISSCPSDIIIPANNAGCTAIATWTAPNASDNCAIGLTLNSTHASGAVFPLGTTAVTYTATDGSGNSSQCSFNVTVTNDLDASVSAADAICNGDSTGAALMFIISGTPAYSYAWSPYGANISNPNNLIAGTYTCTITDGNGCSIVRTAIINDPPAISSNQSPTICSGQSFTVGTNSYTTAATYIDTLSSMNGCDSVVTTILSVIPSPTVSITSNLSAIECQGSVDTLIANGATTYSWNTTSTNDTLTITHASGTTQWIVTGTDPNGCSDADTVSITSVSILTPVFFDLSPDTVCDNAGNISLTGGVPMGGMYSGAGVTGSNFNSFAAGVGTHMITYSVINGNGCISSDSALMLVDLCLANGNNLKLNSGAFIYPNPSNGNFILESISNGELEIYNSIGELVLKQKIQAGKNKLKIENALNGIYLAKVYSENGIQVIRVVKQE